MLKLVPPRPPPPSFIAASFDKWDALLCSTHVHSHDYLQIALSTIIAVASALAVTTHYHQVHTHLYFNMMSK